MKMKLRAEVFVIALLAVVCGAGAQKGGSPTKPGLHHHYKLEILPTLGGTFGQAVGVNNNGSVAGFSTPPGDMVVRPFLWENGVITDLGSLGGPVSVNVENHRVVNDSDAVIGISNTSTPDPNGEDVCGFGTFLICVPFVWQNGNIAALPLLGGNNGQAAGINNRGQIVGVSETPNSDPCSPFFLQIEGTIWQNGQVHELSPYPGDPDGFANSINDAGHAVGVTGCAIGLLHAVLWRNGTVIDLGNLGGIGGNIAFDINSRDQVVGQSDLPGDTTHHAFLWEKGTMSDLGTLYGMPVSLAEGVNNKGQVVGFTQELDASNTVPFLWQNGVIADMNTLIPLGSPLFLQEAFGINNRGQIAGYGQLSDGQRRAYLLTPCDDDHPNIEGCDYSLVEAATIAQRPEARKAPTVSPANVHSLMQRRPRFGGFGVGLPIPQ